MVQKNRSYYYRKWKELENHEVNIWPSGSVQQWRSIYNKDRKIQDRYESNTNEVSSLKKILKEREEFSRKVSEESGKGYLSNLKKQFEAKSSLINRKPRKKRTYVKKEKKKTHD